jgi:hypothetical protein
VQRARRVAVARGLLALDAYDDRLPGAISSAVSTLSLCSRSPTKRFATSRLALANFFASVRA